MNVVTIDVGACTVKVAEFSIPKEGVLTLNRFVMGELGVDPNKEEDRAPLVAATVANLLKQAGIKTSRAVLSLAGHSVFIRFVKLPPVDAIQVEQMIGFEAQQNVPFPIEEVVWDYQFLTNRTGGGETEAIIAAIKTEQLEAETASLLRTGLQPHLIDVAPLALYNAYRYNYEPSDGCVLLIDLGARTTNLLFIEKNHLYTRGIPIAGNLISQNICNEFQEPFTAAETLKKGKGFVSLGGAYSDPTDKDAARISKLVRSTMTRLHNEINRSISFYRTQQGGTAPRRIFLTGGSSLLPYVDVFFAEKLNLPVEYFNPLRNVTLSPQLNQRQLTAGAHFAGEVVGLALREATRCPLEIKLLPPSIKTREEARRRKPYLIGALAAWALLFGCLIASNVRQTHVTQKALEELDSNITNLKSFEAKMAALEAQGDSLKADLDNAQKFLNQRDGWVQLLNDLNQRIPEKVWITQLTPLYQDNNRAYNLDEVIAPGTGTGAGSPPAKNVPAGKNAPRSPSGPQMPPAVNQLVIKGLYDSSLPPEVITRFVEALKDSPWFNIPPDKVSEVIGGIDTIDKDPTQPLALNYYLKLPLKQTIDVRP